MNLSYFEYYLIGINILGFISFAINTWLYANTDDENIDAAITIISILGGALGVVISILLFDRKAQKGTMMSRVFAICILVIQVVIVLMLKGAHKEELTFAFWEFFGKHKVLIVYLICINIVTLIAFGVDKINAIEHKSRIRIVTLLGLAFAGGSIGALLAMYVFRHKTKKDYFAVGVPLIIVMQLVVIFYIMNLKWNFVSYFLA